MKVYNLTSKKIWENFHSIDALVVYTPQWKLSELFINTHPTFSFSHLENFKLYYALRTKICIISMFLFNLTLNLPFNLVFYISCVRSICVPQEMNHKSFCFYVFLWNCCQVFNIHWNKNFLTRWGILKVSFFLPPTLSVFFSSFIDIKEAKLRFHVLFTA